ncbi:hypothetical protein H351_30895 (plasmid) [Rhodococcus erythropolis R138]|uniref:HtaA domain-containing protein n=1 Tax=Rhodococcus erythropolis TaxID=1833 RepID=UPI000568169C|nr:HtaA domain-containing protein [Rhodococcus erythropolis]ALU73704.1 hypothetical protein H351_30895 [Rhodococcus erythropolis R138]
MNLSDSLASDPAISGELEWAILARFTQYVLAMADGHVEVEGRAKQTSNNVFVYPLTSLTTIENHTELRFSGGVRFMGHAGMLDLPVRDPIIFIVNGLCRLEIADPDDTNARLQFASGHLVSDATTLCVDWTLDEPGSELFFYRYPSGFPIDPTIISVDGPGTTGRSSPHL